jgi:hypothetical protein
MKHWFHWARIPIIYKWLLYAIGQGRPAQVFASFFIGENMQRRSAARLITNINFGQGLCRQAGFATVSKFRAALA